MAAYIYRESTCSSVAPFHGIGMRPVFKMGNIIKRIRRPKNHADEIAYAVDDVCDYFRLIPKDTPKYVPAAQKWVLQAEELQTGIQCRVEFFYGSLTEVKHARFKWLRGDYLMYFHDYCNRGNVLIFIYRLLGSVSDYVTSKRLALGYHREVILWNYLRDVLKGIRELRTQHQCHQRLALDEGVYVNLDHKAKIGDLEAIVRDEDANLKSMGAVRHLPPEALQCCLLRRASLEKAQIWILGSMLLEVLVAKHVSGNNYAKPESNLTRKMALRHVRENVPHLHSVLSATNLSASFKELLKSFLRLDPEERMTVDLALVHLSSLNSDRDPSVPLKSTTNGEDEPITRSASSHVQVKEEANDKPITPSSSSHDVQEKEKANDKPITPSSSHDVKEEEEANDKPITRSSSSQAQEKEESKQSETENDATQEVEPQSRMVDKSTQTMDVFVFDASHANRSSKVDGPTPDVQDTETLPSVSQSSSSSETTVTSGASSATESASSTSMTAPSEPSEKSVPISVTPQFSRSYELWQLYAEVRRRRKKRDPHIDDSPDEGYYQNSKDRHTWQVDTATDVDSSTTSTSTLV